MRARPITSYEIGEQSAHKLQRPWGSALRSDDVNRIPDLPRITVKPVRLSDHRFTETCPWCRTKAPCGCDDYLDQENAR